MNYSKIFSSTFLILITLSSFFGSPVLQSQASLGLIRCSAFGGDFADSNKLKAILGTDDITKVDQSKLAYSINEIQAVINEGKTSIQTSQSKAGLGDFVISTSNFGSLDFSSGKCNSNNVTLDYSIPLGITYIKACPDKDFLIDKSSLIFSNKIQDMSKVNWVLDKNMFDQGEQFRIMNLDYNGFYFLEGATQFGNTKNPPNIESADFLKKILKPETPTKLVFGKIKLEKDQAQCTTDKKAVVYEPEFVAKAKQPGTVNSNNLPSSDVNNLFEKLRDKSSSQPSLEQDNNADRVNGNSQNSSNTEINGSNAGDLKIPETKDANGKIIRQDNTPTKPSTLAKDGKSLIVQNPENNTPSPVEILTNSNNWLAILLGFLATTLVFLAGYFGYKKIIQPNLRIFPSSKNKTNSDNSSVIQAQENVGFTSYNPSSNMRTAQPQSEQNLKPTKLPQNLQNLKNKLGQNQIKSQTRFNSFQIKTTPKAIQVTEITKTLADNPIFNKKKTTRPKIDLMAIFKKNLPK